MSRPKMTGAQLENVRGQILDIALAILEEHGPEAISTRAIAERLGVAHMSLYTYFENQAAILSALRERELAKWRVQQQIFAQRAETGEIVQVVQDLLGFFVAFAREKPNLYRMAWVMPEVGGESLEENRRRMRATVEGMAHLLKTGMRRGAFRERDPFLAASTVLAMVNTPYILFHSGRMIDPLLRDRMLEEVLSACMLYLKKD